MGKPGVYAALAVLIAAFGFTTYMVKRSEMTQPLAGPQQGSPSSPGLTGHKSPDFTLASVDGKKVSLAEFNGKSVVLLDFWATWCPPCRAAMPGLAELDDKYGSKGLKVISINQGEDAATVSRFVKETGYKPLVLLDDGPTGKEYRVRAIPTLVLVDKTGKVAAVHEGYSPVTHSQLEEKICKLLGLKYVPDTKMRGVVRFGNH